MQCHKEAGGSGSKALLVGNWILRTVLAFRPCSVQVREILPVTGLPASKSDATKKYPKILMTKTVVCVPAVFSLLTVERSFTRYCGSRQVPPQPVWVSLRRVPNDVPNKNWGLANRFLVVRHLISTILLYQDNLAGYVAVFFITGTSPSCPYLTRHHQ
jgi:hypothetical protein